MQLQAHVKVNNCAKSIWCALFMYTDIVAGIKCKIKNKLNYKQINRSVEKHVWVYLNMTVETQWKSDNSNQWQSQKSFQNQEPIFIYPC